MAATYDAAGAASVPDLCLPVPPGAMAEDWGGPSAWHKHPVFAHYWRHYRQVMDWAAAPAAPAPAPTAVVTPAVLKEFQHQRQHYLSAYSAISSQAGSLREHLARLREQRAERSRRKRRNRRRARAATYGSGPSGTVAIPPEEELEELEEEEEEALDEHLLDFFRRTAAHQAARDATKREEEGDYADVCDAALPSVQLVRRASESAPAEAPGARRAAEMRQLYGAGAEVFGLETGLQLRFDAACDRGGAARPQLWPVMPLRPQFGKPRPRGEADSWLERVVPLQQ